MTERFNIREEDFAKILEITNAILSRNERLSNLRFQFSDIVHNYENLVEQRRFLVAKKNALESKLKYMEAVTRREVTDETGSDGKKRYTNAEQREDATTLRLGDDAEYATAKSGLQEINLSLMEIEDQIGLSKMRLRVAEATLAIEKMEKGERE
jgi:hypothetical protein